MIQGRRLDICKARLTAEISSDEFKSMDGACIS